MIRGEIVLDISCNEFIDQLSSKSPVPGGGGASAYVGSIGMSLGSMVGNLTVGKKKYADVQDDIEILLEKSLIIIEALKALAEKDAEVFYPLSQAYGLPQNTDDEKKLKEIEIQKVLYDATIVPLEIARQCLKAIEVHEEYAKKGTRIAISDAGVGVVFCKSAIMGAKLNVLINTKIMKDKNLKESIEKEIQEIVNSGSEKADKVYNYVEELLKN
jgi:formiminotetrahydrofolate cyclodeaminase